MLENEFSRLLAVELINHQPLRRQVRANSDEMRRLAQRFDLFKLDELQADLVIQYIADQEIEIKGIIAAKFEERHVKTLQPVPRVIKKSFSLILGRHIPEGYDANEDHQGHRELLKDWVVGGQLDIGEIVVQELSDELDLYPGISDIIKPDS